MRCSLAKLALICVVMLAGIAQAQEKRPSQRLFESPEAAVSAFIAACEANDTKELIAIFGPIVEQETDRIDDAEERANRALIAEMAKQVRRIEERSDSTRVVLLGLELWPFPMPMVQTSSGWRFDTESGIDELRRRRIGRNELTAIDVCRAFVDAQHEYAQVDHDGDGIPEFAQKILSTAGQHDGLYWESKADTGEPLSPLGPFLAEADATVKSGKSQGYLGYRFKVLTEQGKHAPDGKSPYLKNKNMTDGFALIAWPTDYGHSGVMTFIVSHHGAVYEKDLGPKTETLSTKTSRFDPDPSWKLVTEAP